MSVINGTAAGETLTGTSSADTINGLGGNDTINAGDGADTIDGGTGADLVHGNSGNDIVTIGAGDTIYGDANDDTFNFTSTGAASIGATTYVDGGIDSDAITLDFSSAVDVISTSTSSNGSGYAGNIYYYNMERVTIYGGSASDLLFGNAGNDRLDGNAGNDRLYGGLGVNTLNGGAGTDYGEVDLSNTSTALNFTFTGGTNLSLGGNTLTGIEGLGVFLGTGADTASVANATAASRLDGGVGADTLTGSATYADTLNGNDGNDQIYGAFGDTINGGNDDDTLRIALGLQMATTYADGAAGSADRLAIAWSAATDGVTSYNSGSGNGSISVQGSTVYYYNIETLSIYGGTASDQLAGGSGNDLLVGGAGNDVIDGGRGTDTLDGGTGNDRGLIDNSDSNAARTIVFVSGQTLNVAGDKLTGFEGLGYRGGSGADSVNVAGATISSSVYGGDGNDTLRSDNAIGDTIDGGSGLDLITFGAGDNINGRDGNDSFVFASDVPSFATTYADGDVGDDLLTLDFSASPDGVASSNSGTGNGNIGNLYYYNIERLKITGSSGSDTLIGGIGDDTISGGTGNDSVDGGRGANTLDGGAGVDLGSVDLSTTSTGLTVTFVGNQTLSVGGNTLSHFEGLGLRAGTGNDTISVVGATRASAIYGGGGNDTITGSSKFADVLDGGDGNDTLTGNAGDVVNGRGDDDTLRFYLSLSSFASTYAYGDAGVDKLIVSFSASSDGVSSSSNGATNGYIGNLYYYDVESVEFTGSTASDTLVGGSGNDKLTGGSGDDRLDGGLGANTISGGVGLDIALVDLSTDATARTVSLSTSGTVSGTTSTITGVEGLGFKGGIGADHISAANGTRGSEIYGGAGDDVVTGSATVADVLDGGDNNDTITGGSGDSVNGQAGDDALNFSGAGPYAATTYAYGGAGIDVLTVNFSSSVAGVDLSGNASNNGNGYFAGIYWYDMERVVITAGAGNDTIQGVAGNDSLTGGDGNDILIGNAGADTLTGNAGNDIFRYYDVADSTVTTAGRDTIAGFASTDQIDLSNIDADSGTSGNQAFSFIGTAAFSGSAGQLRYQTSGSDRLISGDVNGDGAADFAILVTGSGTITSGAFSL